MWSLPLASSLSFFSEDQNSYGRMSDRSEPMFLPSNIHLVSLHLYAVNISTAVVFLSFLLIFNCQQPHSCQYAGFM